MYPPFTATVAFVVIDLVTGLEVSTSRTITDLFSIMGLSPYGHSAAAALEASAFFCYFFCAC
jgi:hypothetical protein